MWINCLGCIYPWCWVYAIVTYSTRFICYIVPFVFSSTWWSKGFYWENVVSFTSIYFFICSSVFKVYIKFFASDANIFRCVYCCISFFCGRSFTYFYRFRIVINVWIVDFIFIAWIASKNIYFRKFFWSIILFCVDIFKDNRWCVSCFNISAKAMNVICVFIVKWYCFKL